MGMYFSSTIKCLNCGNKNTFDTNFFIAPEQLTYVIEKKPRIICGRCNSERIVVSDDSFFSYNMTYDTSGDIVYVPENTNEIWLLPDCSQRLPDTIYVNIDIYFDRYNKEKICNTLVRFSEFNRFIIKDDSLIEFRRTAKINEQEDSFKGVPVEYEQYTLNIAYLDRENTSEK